jgi:hypothetical protein
LNRTLVEALEALEPETVVEAAGMVLRMPKAPPCGCITVRKPGARDLTRLCAGHAELVAPTTAWVVPRGPSPRP